MQVNALDMQSENPGSLSPALLAEGDRQAYRFNVLQRTDEDARQGQAGMAWQGTLGGWDGEVAAWGIHRSFRGRIPPSVIEFGRRAGGARALVGGARPAGVGTFAWRAGVEAEIQRDDRRNWDNEGGEEGALSLDQLERVRGTGVFIQGRWDLTRSVAASAGLRYDRFRFRVSDRFLLDTTDDGGSRTLQALSPSAGIVYAPGDRLELFVSASSFFETPTTTELANRPTGAGGFNPDLDPTRGRTWEGGVRSRLGEAWSAEIVLFRTTLDGELVPFEGPTSPGRTFYRNAGRSHHRGWEATLEGSPARLLRTRLAVTRVDGRFDAYTVDGEDLGGNRIPGLAPYRADGRVALVGDAGFAELRLLAQDAMPVDDANEAESAGYVLADLRVGLSDSLRGGLTVSPFLAVSTLLDRSYHTSVVVNAFGGRYYEPGPGRSLQVGMRVVGGPRNVR